VLNAEFTAERDRLGTYVPSLAIIGSASPLLGLFGTVLGVIAAFTGIAKSGSGNLSAVAPGVAEALIATAAALAVAVPAVFGYNMFAARLNRMDGQLDGFGAELIALLAREGRI
jgi:biopolymer transport protein TolQ